MQCAKSEKQQRREDREIKARRTKHKSRGAEQTGKKGKNEKQTEKQDSKEAEKLLGRARKDVYIYIHIYIYIYIYILRYIYIQYMLSYAFRKVVLSSRATLYANKGWLGQTLVEPQVPQGSRKRSEKC